MNKYVVLFGLSFLVSACSSYQTEYNSDNYLHTTNGPHLQVPYPLFAGNMSHFYDLPPAPQAADISVLPPH